ncbi:MAG: right-handed parallel beta-helix repeat-containing protein [Candidatus Pacearchaeota archaeon]
MKKIFLLIAVLFSVISIHVTLASGATLSACGTIGSSGYYQLTESINTTSTCVTIASSNVDLDCGGHYINYSTAGGATVFGVDVLYGVTPLYNVTVRNCNIVKPSNGSTAGYGIRMQRTSNSFIYNNTILTNGTTNNYGVYLLTNSNNNRIENNTIGAYGTSTGNIGIYLLSNSNNNNITGNLVNTYGTTTGYAIFASTDSNDNLIKNNNLSTYSIITAASSGHTVNIFSSKRNDVIDNYIFSSGIGTNYAVYLNVNANSNLIRNNIITTIGSATANYGIYSLTSRLNRLENNTIRTYGTSGNIGIITSGSYYTNITNNDILANGSTTGNIGVSITDSLDMKLENNTISTAGTTTGYGISLTTSSYIDILNNTIRTNGTGATNTGILVTTAFFNKIDKNYISTWGTSANAGIFLTTTSNENIISNNTILASGTTTTNYGIYLTQSQFNDVSNNNITTNGTTSNYGIYLITNANVNTFSDNVITTYGTTTNYGILLSTASYNLFNRNNISTNGTGGLSGTNNWGIHLTINSYENEFYNSTVYTDGGGSNYGVYLLTDCNTNTIQGSTITARGNSTLNIGVLLTASSNNIIKENVISTSGTTTNYGVQLFSNSAHNLIEQNNITTVATSTQTAHAFYLLFSTPNYPIANNISKNNLLSISGNDLQVGTASINDTDLIDQKITNYSFTGLSGLLNIINTSAGEIRFGPVLSGTNTTFSNRIYVQDNFAFIDEYTTLLNRSAEITIFNRSTTSTELQILRYGSVCPSNICTNITSMQAGNVRFNVTAGGNYSISAVSGNPTVNLNLPESGFNFTTNSIYFNFTASDDVSTILNCSIYLNSSINQTNSSVSSGVLTNFLVQNIAQGNYSWYVSCFDEANNLGTSITRNFSVVYTVPSVTFNSPSNASYLDNVNSVLLNYTLYDMGLNNMTVWLYGNGSILNVSYNVTNGTNLGYTWTGLSNGQNNWTIISNNGLVNSTSPQYYFNKINLTMNCEAGGPYQDGAVVLVQGNISDGTSGISSHSVNVSFHKDGTISSSKTVNSLSDGSFQTTFSSLSGGSHTLNASISYHGNNKSCEDTISLGGTAASLILDKIVTFYNISNSTINYNVTLRLTNKGGTSSVETNITDADSTSSPYLVGDLAAGEYNLRSYLLNYTRESAFYYVNLSMANSYGFDGSTNDTLNSNSSIIAIAIPSTEEGQQVILTKNAYFNSENSTAVNYTLLVEAVNSGGVDLEDITLIDSDLNINLLINLTKTEIYKYNSSVIIQKSASNTQKLFVKATATVNSVTSSSNQINIQIPGYGGPADTIVYAQASVSPSASFDTTIEIINQNPDVGQNFIADYWITDDTETTNYSSGQQTIYVGASGRTNLTATLTSPSTPGNYKLRALVDYVGGPDRAFDSFEVTAEESQASVSSSSSGGGSSSGSGSITGGVVEEIVCNAPYIRYGKECCLDQNTNNICDSDESLTNSNSFGDDVSEQEDIFRAEESNIGRILDNITNFFSKITSINGKSINANYIYLAAMLLVGVIFIIGIKLLSIRRYPVVSKKLSNIRGTKAYLENGDYFGEIKDVYLDYKNQKIYGWLIKPKKLTTSHKNKLVLVRHNSVKSINNIMIVDTQVLEHLENFTIGK